MTSYLRARGLLWSLPVALLALAAAAWFGHWLEAKPQFDHLSRVPAVVLGGLAAAVLVAPGWHRVEDEVEGSAARPTRTVELSITACLLTISALVATVASPLVPLERGGLETARDVLGLGGLALLAGAVLGSRLAWSLPFVWASVSYFAVTREYDGGVQSAIGWLMFPGTFATTWFVAVGLLVAGFAAYAWGGFTPLPRRHPRR
jgi:hypothetical protein